MATKYEKRFPLNRTIQAYAYETRTNSSPNWATHSSQDIVTLHEEAAGEGYHGFHKLIKEGAFLPYTKWTQNKSTAIVTPGFYRASHDSSSYWEEARGLHPIVSENAGPSAHVPDTSQYVYFIQEAAARIATKGWDGLTASTELGKTVRSFKRIVPKMVDLTRKFSPKKLNDLWLEGRYSFRTLAYDLKDLHEAVTEFDDKRKIWTERAGNSYTVVNDETTPITTSDTNWTLSKSVTTEVSVRGAVCGVIEPQRVNTNPIATAWELTRFSFIVDWVYDIGTAIDAITFLACAKKYTAAYGVYLNETCTEEFAGTARAGWTGTYSPFKIEVERVSTKRTPSGISVTPQLTNRELTGALALDLQALSRIRR